MLAWCVFALKGAKPMVIRGPCSNTLSLTGSQAHTDIKEK